MPLLSTTKSVVPSPSRSDALAMVIFVVLAVRSKATSPVRLWPAMLMTMPVPATRTKGPAGTSRLTVVPARVTDSVTREDVLLISRLKAPVTVTLAGSSPARLTVPPSRPARPVGATMKMPSMPSSSAAWPAARVRLPPVTARTVRLAPPAVAWDVKLNDAVRVGPPSESAMPSPTIRT